MPGSPGQPAAAGWRVVAAAAAAACHHRSIARPDTQAARAWLAGAPAGGRPTAAGPRACLGQQVSDPCVAAPGQSYRLRPHGVEECMWMSCRTRAGERHVARPNGSGLHVWAASQSRDPLGDAERACCPASHSCRMPPCLSVWAASQSRDQLGDAERACSPASHSSRMDPWQLRSSKGARRAVPAAVDHDHVPPAGRRAQLHQAPLPQARR